MARTGLGRGLDVLLGQPSLGPTPVPAPATEIPLDKVTPNPQQPRTQFDPEALAELAASIRQHGVLQPVVVSRNGDGYELVAGQRRVLAARLSTADGDLRPHAGAARRTAWQVSVRGREHPAHADRPAAAPGRRARRQDRGG